jgi:hypothetical protein
MGFLLYHAIQDIKKLRDQISFIYFAMQRSKVTKKDPLNDMLSGCLVPKTEIHVVVSCLGTVHSFIFHRCLKICIHQSHLLYSFI